MDGGAQDAGSTGWRYVGLPGFSPGLASKTAIAVHAGVPWVAFADQTEGNKLVAWRFEGGAWARHGAALSDAAVMDVSLLSCGGRLFLGYRSLKVPSPFDAGFVLELSGAGWAPVGAQLGGVGAAAYALTLACAPGGPVAAWSAATTGPLQVARLEGTSWVAQGGAHGLAANVGLGLAVSPTGAVHVAFASALDGNRLAVRRVEETSTVAVGAALLGAQGVAYATLGFAGETPVVAALDLAGLEVQRFSQGTWGSLGTGLLSAEGEPADLPRLVTGDDGAAWLLARSSTAGFSHGATVTRVGATTLELSLGGVFTEHTAGEPSLAVVAGQPWVAFQDWAHQKRLSVMTRAP